MVERGRKADALILASRSYPSPVILYDMMVVLIVPIYQHLNTIAGCSRIVNR